MKKKRKIEQFYNDVSEKGKGREEMRLQTDQEFQQNNIKKLKTEFNVRMSSIKVMECKTFAAKQKVREF